MKSDLKYYLISFFVIVILSIGYMFPQIENKVMAGHDVKTYLGMSKEARDYNEKNDDIALWTNALFGGMPTYQVGGVVSPNVFRFFHGILNFLGRPASFIFLYLFGGFIAFLLFGFDWKFSLIGSIAYSFSTYLFIIIDAGHSSKSLALAYMPPIIAGVYAAYNGKRWLGTAFFSIFLALQLLVNHIQITYYTFLVILVFAIFQIVKDIHENKIKQFFLTSLVLLIPAILAVGSNATVLFTTMEYTPYSTRGPSELTLGGENKTTGLDAEYITQYSLGVDETFSFLIPNIKGGPSMGSLSEDSEIYKIFERAQGAATAKRVIKQLPLYWGPQYSTNGPIYLGAVVLFLFILGLFLVKNKLLKWWVIVVALLSIMLSWGRNFMWLSELFINYFPMYNKFRSVNMTVVMASFVIPVLSMFSLRRIIQKELDRKEFLKYFKYSIYFIGGILLFFILFSGSLYSFSSPYDEQAFGGQQVLIEAIRKDRQALLVNDAIRAFILIAIAATFILLFYNKKIKKDVLIIALGAIILFDLWTVNKRVVNEDDFVTSRELKQPFVETTADKAILQDNDPDFRVLDLTESVFNSARASYFHKSIGGYHGAKMQRYQELIQYHISDEINTLVTTLRQQATPTAIDSTFAKTNVLNMLNTKYVIVNPERNPLVNNKALNNAWLVSNYEFVENADEEIQRLRDIEPSETAIIDQRFQDMIPDGISKQVDSDEYIRLIEYQPNYLRYNANVNDKQLALFSEIYYPKGWQAYINGEEVSHFWANYVLRAMIIPPGEHTIEFEFNPKSYYIGNTISKASSITLILLIIGFFIYDFRTRKKNVE